MLTRDLSAPGSRCSSAWSRLLLGADRRHGCSALLAGAFGGWVDTCVMRFVDIMLSIPGLLFAIAIAALLGPSLTR